MKLLIIKLNALGDLVIATPAFRRIREGLLGAKIHLLTTDWSAPAVMGNTSIDEVLVVSNDIFFKPSWRTFQPTLRLISQLRQNRYFAAVVFHKHRAVHRFVKTLGIERSFGFVGEYEQSADGIVLDESRHSALTAWELADLAVRELGGSNVTIPRLDDMRYDWSCSDQELIEARLILQRWGLDGQPMVVLFPGGGKNPNVTEPVRRWPAAKWAELGHRLMAHYQCKVVLLGNDDDKSVCAQVNSLAGGRFYNLSGRYGIRHTAAMLKSAKLVVTNDSAPVHIAAAVGALTVGIYGPNGAQHKLPPGTHCLGISLGLPCSPCFFAVFKGCIFETIRCMEELETDLVMKKIQEFVVRFSTPQ